MYNGVNMADIIEPGSLEAHVVSHGEGWAGFESDTLYAHMPTLSEKQRMLQYPLIRSAVRMIVLPLLSADNKTDTQNKAQDNLLKHWFRTCYRQVATTLLTKGVSWGFSAGEKIYSPVDIDGKKYLLVTGIIAPESSNIKINYTKDTPLEVEGFNYGMYHVARERMAYYIYQGDEICRPYGVSICDDVYWAWKQLMQDWSRWGIYKDFKAIPPFKLEYPEKPVAQANGSIIDANDTIAQNKLKDLRNLSGIALPRRYNRDTRQWESIWQLTEIEIAEKTTAFIDSINKLETMIFIGSLIPKRIIEQDMSVGAYAMLREQADFFYVILKARLEEWEEYMRRWIINPMLQLNFGKVDANVNLDFGDELFAWYLDTLKQAIAGGLVTPNWKEIFNRVGAPIEEEETDVSPRGDEPEIESEHATQFASKKLPTRAQIQKQKNQIALDWLKRINPGLQRLKVATYNEIVDGLKQVQGKVGLRVVALYRNGIDKVKTTDLAGAVQIPRNIFNIMLQRLREAYELGYTTVYEKKGEELPEIRIKPVASTRLHYLADKFTGLGGRHVIGGQPEMLEERLFYACQSATKHEDVLNLFNQAFNNYIDVTLPDNVLNELNIATQYGVKDAVRELAIIQAKKLKEGE